MQDLLAAVSDAVRSVGRLEVMPRYLKVAHTRKADGSAFTEADLAAQEALIARLQAIIPAPVLAEEQTEAEQQAAWAAAKDGRLWCVDPIDGTSNFVTGLPYFAISVALIRAGRPLLGVVYDPVADELFAASAGGGASLNGVALPLRPAPIDLNRCMAGIDFKRLPSALAVRLVATPPYASQRNLGASTLDWCYLAAGRLHLYLHGGQKLWDYAAGWLILTEAGGQAETLDGAVYWEDEPWTRSVVASLDPVVQAQWRLWLTQ
jgi:myo-inositol-1(or 4)-monophosphatase